LPRAAHLLLEFGTGVPVELELLQDAFAVHDDVSVDRAEMATGVQQPAGPSLEMITMFTILMGRRAGQPDCEKRGNIFKN
jgi:hypothetical protein